MLYIKNGVDDFQDWSYNTLKLMVDFALNVSRAMKKWEGARISTVQNIYIFANKINQSKAVATCIKEDEAYMFNTSLACMHALHEPSNMNTNYTHGHACLHAFMSLYMYVCVKCVYVCMHVSIHIS